MYIDIITLPRKKEEVFEIQCAYHENTLPSNMPSKRWDKRSKRWRAPIVRLNIEFLKANRQLFECSEEVQAVFDRVAVVKEEEEEEEERSFPKKYPFKTTPMNHQFDCLTKLYSQSKQAIFADIGTGKTKMAIDMATARYFEGLISKVLVVALVSIKTNWAEEIVIHSPVTGAIHELQTTKAGQNRYKMFLEEDGMRWLIVGVESLSAGKAFSLCEQFVDDETMIIVDESDSIKTDGKIRTDRCIELGKKTEYKTIMTGTPITQGIVDLYSQFQFLDKDIIGVGDFYSFRNRYAIMGGFEQRQIIGYQRVEELLEALDPYIFQVRKRDVLKDLPESSYQKYTVSMSAEQKKLYAKLKQDLMMEYQGRRLTVKSTVNLMQRFTEITGGFYSYVDQKAMAEIPTTEKAKIKYKKAYLKSNPKADELFKFAKSLPEDEPLIIWAISKMEVDFLVDMFAKEWGMDSIRQMHGRVSKEDRDLGLKDFEAGKARWLIGNQNVGGIGLNMTRACIMAYFSNDFSLRSRIQSEGRIERIGQKRPMLYVDFQCANSIDKYVVQALTDKNDFAEAIRAAFDNGTIGDLV